MNENKHRTVGNIVVALIVGISLITCTVIGVNGLIKIKRNNTSIVVTGSAKQQITSDLIVWTGSFKTQSNVLTDAYKSLEASREKVKKYLADQGIPDEDIVFTSIHTWPYYLYDDFGNYTNQIDYYELSQNVKISSSEIDKVTDISRNATDLLNEGVEFSSNDPQYIYTKLADMKVAMLAEATKDARKRAEMIAENAGSKIGELSYADMGVMQITPIYSNDVSDSGYSDTTSLEKEITAVVHCTFTIE